MRILLRADNPGGRGRAATVLRNQGLIFTTKDFGTGPDVDRPVDGLRIDEIGPIDISPGVVDPAYHANLWIVEPLRQQLKDAFTGTPIGDEDADNDLFDKLRAAGTHTVAAVINGIKRPEGYTTASNVSFYLPRWVATHRRVWA